MEPFFFHYYLWKYTRLCEVVNGGQHLVAGLYCPGINFICTLCCNKVNKFRNSFNVGILKSSLKNLACTLSTSGRDDGGTRCDSFCIHIPAKAIQSGRVREIRQHNLSYVLYGAIGSFYGYRSISSN